MRLPKAERSLYQLVEYLWQTTDLPRSLLDSLAVMHARMADQMNRRKARQFCFVTRDSSHIRCAADIENVSERVRIGLLLHEIGHIVLDAFHSTSPEFDDVEVRVDEWCVGEFPESGYKLSDHVYKTAAGRKRVARNVQRVSQKFIDAIYEE